MSISPINFNGMIQNTNEISNAKLQEDQKPILQQANSSVEVEKQQDRNSHQVNGLQNSAKEELHYDREGDGKGYQGNQHNKNKKEKKSEDGTVTKKSSSSFDIRI